MTITSTWYDEEKTIVLLEYRGEWTWEEYYNATEVAHLMMQTVPHRVDMITHRTDKLALRTPGAAITHWQRAIKAAPKNMGIIVAVPDNMFISTYASLMQKILGVGFENRIHCAQTIEAALNVIETHKSKTV
jgi:hypothetical protein